MNADGETISSIESLLEDKVVSRMYPLPFSIPPHATRIHLFEPSFGYLGGQLACSFKPHNDEQFPPFKREESISLSSDAQAWPVVHWIATFAPT